MTTANDARRLSLGNADWEMLTGNHERPLRIDTIATATAIACRCRHDPKNRTKPPGIVRRKFYLSGAVARVCVLNYNDLLHLLTAPPIDPVLLESDE
jgi:hypothetical protein